jgi:hypothetical protein
VTGAKYLSSSMVACVVPARSDGRVEVSVSNSASHPTRGGIDVAFVSPLAALIATPSAGPAMGGTPVTLRPLQPTPSFPNPELEAPHPGP